MHDAIWYCIRLASRATAHGANNVCKQQIMYFNAELNPGSFLVASAYNVFLIKQDLPAPETLQQ